ncbi:MAG: HAD family hydrolase [Acidimicrobiales bacterium]|nr:HAD family hydrolase [Acidimicrobiales bacterium]
MSIQAVAFDVDQTLWDFHSHRRAALVACLELLCNRATCEAPWAWSIDDLQARYDRIEASAPGERLATIRHESLVEAAAEAAPGDNSLGDELTDLYFSIRHGPASPFDDATQCLDRLAGMGVRLAVVTNGNSDLVGLGLAEYFEVIVVGPDIGMAKPEARIYAEVSKRLAVTPSELVCVGDDPVKDVAAPQRLGWKGVWNDRKVVTLPPDVRPDATIEHLAELPPIVARWR